jgi:CHAT domain-containing protein
MRRIYLRLVECEAKLGQPMEALRVLEDGRALAWRKRLQESDAAQAAPASPDAPPDTAVQWFAAQRQRTLAAQAFMNAQANLAAARERKAGAAEIAKLEKATAESEKRFGQTAAAAMQARRESEMAWEKAHAASAELAPAKVELDTLLAALPPGTVYAAYSIHNQGAVLALARREAAGAKPVVTSYVLTLPDGKKPASDLNVRCEEFTAAARNTRVPLATIQQQGRELGDILFPAEARAILAKAQHLIVSPDGPLWEVPLAALRLSQEGGERYLSEICPLSVVPSLAVLAQLQKRLAAGAKVNALVVGNPTYDKAGAKSRGFAPLPETAQEGTSVAKIYATTPLLAAKPTESAVRAAMAKADVIHLATHGTFDDQRAMASGIALAAGSGKDATSADDGLLQASEIYGQLRLHAQLVVLSSCEGGRGEVLTIGEGAVGLPWALQVAGARAVLASLWRVGGGTKELMTEFHQRLARDEAQDTALQAAMRRVRETPGWEHPYYWSAFLINGDARGLKAATP